VSKSAYERSVEELFRAPLDGFVAERKRLAAALKASGDAAGATELAALRRPTTSAWTVNQLWWHARDAFDELLSAAKRVRKGERDATPAYRDALAALRKRAAAILTEAGHGASETIVRRVATTLSALAATGGFDPDPPGTLSADRDPPGFEVVDPRATTHPTPGPRPTLRKVPASKDDRTDAKARAAAEAAERAERERREAEAARRRTERHRIETKLRTAQADAAKRDRDVERCRRDLADAERVAADVRARIAELERSLAELDEQDAD